MKLHKSTIKWLKTNKLYNKWVSKKEIRNFFSENICYEGLSLWWISRIVAKDNVIENDWYIRINKILCGEKSNHKYNWVIFFLKLCKSFLKNLINLSFFKIIFFYKSKFEFKNFNYNNCFHSIDYNLQELNRNEYIDRLYGKSIFTNAKENFYLITATNKILSFLKKKIRINFYVSNSYLNYFDLLKIYFVSLFKLIKVINFCNQNPQLFFINKKDCGSVLKPMIFDSFCGYIQDSLIQGISIGNFLKKKNIKNFICYGEFNQGYRAVYYFVKNKNPSIKVTSVHHGYANENLLFFNHHKEEFNLKNKEGKNCSPMPDQYLVQGSQYANILKKYYPKKIVIIGCLKYDLLDFKKTKNRIKKNKICNIVIAPSIGDEKDILEYLKYFSSKEKNNLKKFKFYLSPHPVIKDKTIKFYKDNLPDLNLNTSNNNTFQKIKKCDLLICGFSTVAYEAAIIGKPSIRLVNPSSPILFHIKDKIKKIFNFESFINEIKKNNHKLINRDNIIKYFYFKLDGNTHKRFWNSIN